MSYSDPPPPPQGGQGQYGGDQGDQGSGGYGAPPPGYGQDPGYGQQPQKNSPMAITALVLGIIGAIPCFWGCFIFSILGVVFGLLGKKDVRESNGAKKGENLAKWGLILGVAGIVLGIIYWILFAAGVIEFQAYNEMS